VRAQTADDPAAAGLHPGAEVLDVRAAGLHQLRPFSLNRLLLRGLGESRRGQRDGAGG
jgi:hypothetical protein